MVHNLHERVIAAPPGEVGKLIDSLGTKNDRHWPRHDWPAMHMDEPLGVGSAGGHGPVRYFVTRYEPGRTIAFQFTRPWGFKGHHAVTVTRLADDSTLLRHELAMSTKGMAIITWPLFFRPMHNALVEELLDRAERECGNPPRHPHRRSLWTKILRAPFSARISRIHAAA